MPLNFLIKFPLHDFNFPLSDDLFLSGTTFIVRHDFYFMARLLFSGTTFIFWHDFFFFRHDFYRPARLLFYGTTFIFWHDFSFFSGTTFIFWHDFFFRHDFWRKPWERIQRPKNCGRIEHMENKMAESVESVLEDTTEKVGNLCNLLYVMDLQ